jgi:hypothetical protein
MRNGAAHHRGVPLARPHEIGDELAAALHETQVLDALDRTADECIDPPHAAPS